MRIFRKIKNALRLAKRSMKYGFDNVWQGHCVEKLRAELSYPLLVTDKYKNVQDKRMRRDLADETRSFLVIILTDGLTDAQIQKCKASLEEQIYPNYDVVIVGEENTSATIGETSDQIQTATNINAVAQEINAAVENSAADDIVLLSRGDCLHSYALGEIALNKRNAVFPEESLIYTDKIEFDAKGKIKDTCFKPNFGPETFRESNIVGDTFFVSRKLWLECGGLREISGARISGEQAIESQTSGNVKTAILDFVVRLAAPENLSRICHHAEPIVIGNCEVPIHDYSDAATREIMTAYQANWGMKNELTNHPLVTIMIPSKDHIDVLDTCLTSILEKSTYDNYEILIIENNSTEQETFAYYEKIQADSRVQVVNCVTDWNYSYINNYGFKSAKGDYIILLNNDTEVITPDWMEQMLLIAERSQVGAVGAKLLFPDGTIQHAGVTFGIRGVAGHSFHGCDGNEKGYLNRIATRQNLTAVTAACMMIPRHVYEEVEGFDENLKVAFNDTELCLRIREKGYEVIYTPTVELIHYESKSRGADVKQDKEKARRLYQEGLYFQRRWYVHLMEGDPYYNRNLSYESDNFDPIATYLREE